MAAKNYDWSTYLSNRNRPDALLNLLASGMSVEDSGGMEAPAAPNKTKVKKVSGGKGQGKPGQIFEMFHDPGFNWDSGRKTGAIGGHGGHVHVAADSKRVVYLGKLARRMGLRVAEHPAFDKVDPVHTSGSFHYKNQAIDVSGSPERMKQFNNLVRRMYNLK